MDDFSYDIIIEPCYAIYEREKNTALLRLHTLWQDYRNEWCSNDIQGVVAAWHGVMAIVQILRDRGEWDDDKGKPKPFFVNAPEPKYKEKCPKCHCNCTWDQEAYALWDGLCPACGGVLDVLKTKEAA